MLSDVTGVVLSVGEPYAERAVESLARQTYPIHETVTIEHVAPFSRALNLAAHRVTTPFFVQVDADMILDAHCVAALRQTMRDRTGLACAELRDPLLGQVVGVKLYRRACFGTIDLRDSVSPCTDFVDDITASGWTVDYYAGADRTPEGRTLGEHRPDYSPDYSYKKFLLEGRRYRHRGARDGMRWNYKRLAGSTHPMAVFAQLVVGHGFFIDVDHDELRPSGPDPAATRLAELLLSRGTESKQAEEFRVDHLDRLRDVFRVAVTAGADLANAGAGASIVELMESLRARNDLRGFVAKIGVGHGVVGGFDARLLDASERLLGPFVSDANSASRWVRARQFAKTMAARVGAAESETRW